jgi:hypothetical protein
VKLRNLDATKLSDATAEKVRTSHADAIRELQGLLVVPKVFSVRIDNNTYITIAHGLGRAPKFISFSPPYPPDGVQPAGGLTAGEIIENRGPTIDRTKVIVIGAFAWGRAITFDVKVE